MSRTLALLIAGGVGLRLALALTTHGAAFDIDKLALVAASAQDDPLHLYRVTGWPYPPLGVLWIWLAGRMDGVIAFDVAIRLLPIAADAVTIWLVHALLRDGQERRALAGAALVAFGPTFVAVSGFHGHVDPLGLPPALGALLVWSRGGSSRAWIAGLLIGVAAAVKTPYLLVLAALLPTAAGRREWLQLIVAALAVPLVTVAPFVVADASGVLSAARYRGLPGLGGLSLLVQPDLAAQILTDRVPHLSGASRALDRIAPALTVVPLVALTASLIRRRVAPETAAVLLWLTFSVVAVSFFVHWFVWVIPFLVVAGMLREAAAIQALVLAPTIVYYGTPWDTTTVVWVLYVPLMAAALVATAAMLARAARPTMSRHEP